jgi:hypothetical protein
MNRLIKVHVDLLSLRFIEEVSVGAQTSFGSARNLHLARAARVAGEAFAFNEPETAPARRSIPISLLGIVLGIVAAAILVSIF